jgi:glycosyltransferase involved in cell wall biosynthesis
VRRAAFVAAVSSYGRSQLFRWVAHEHWGKVKVVHCGLERSFHDVPAVAVPSAPRLVCVGRLCEQKGQLLLLEAARLLAAQAVEFELVLAGDGEMREQLEALIARHGLQAQVRIPAGSAATGTRGNPRRPRAGLAKLRRGLAGGHHGSHGLAPPGADHLCGGYPRAGNARRERLVVPGGGVEELATAMADCLAQPAHVLQRMGEAAYQRVLQRHDIDTEAARLASYFKASA